MLRHTSTFVGEEDFDVLVARAADADQCSPLLRDGGELEGLHDKLEIVFSYWLSVEQENSPHYHEEMNRETVRFWLQDVAERGAFCERFGIDLSSYLDRIDWVRIEESDHPLDEVAYSEVVNNN